LPKDGKLKGFEDLSPTIVAQQLFGHLPAGAKVAIVTFVAGKSGKHHDLKKAHVYPYVKAQARGLIVRVVTPITTTDLTTDMHDFWLFNANAKRTGRHGQVDLSVLGQYIGRRAAPTTVFH
jgi:hypothetical protein